MKLVIDRQKWLRGEGGVKSYLLRESDGKMCCVGFYALALGCSPEEIRSVKQLHRVNAVGQCNWVRSEDMFGLYGVNDRTNTRPEDREAGIKEIFAEHDVQVEFVN